MSDEVDKTSKNEHGFSLYPKMVYPDGPGTDAVIVNNIQQEMEVMGTAPADPVVDLAGAPKANWP